MSDETNTEQQPPADEQAPEQAPRVELPEVDEDEPTGYAVYDHTLARYVTGVVTKSEANKAVKGGPEGHELEARRV